jgi:hypothetical protein
MLTMNPTLLIGPADWDSARFPRGEFDARIAALWDDHPQALGAIVYGEARDHAALAYFTHLTPKLEAAIALIPRQGDPRLLIGGGPNMLPAARPLTFVSDLAPLRGAAGIGEWARALPPGEIVLIGGEAMPYALRRALDGSLASAGVVSGDAAVTSRMRMKSPRELDALRDACGTLEKTVAVLRSEFDASKGMTDVVLAAEHAALHAGAQDVRSLFSRDHALIFRPFDLPFVAHADPAHVYLAVRHDGYWVDAYLTLNTRSSPLQAAARASLDAMVAAIAPGRLASEPWQARGNSVADLRIHPLTERVCGSAIGLGLDQAPLLTRDSDHAFRPGEVYSIRAMLSGRGRSEIASAIVIVSDHGVERIFPALEAA